MNVHYPRENAESTHRRADCSSRIKRDFRRDVSPYANAPRIQTCRNARGCCAPNRAYKILIARAASSAMTAREIVDCIITRTFAHRESTGASVGEKAVLVLKARKT